MPLPSRLLIACAALFLAAAVLRRFHQILRLMSTRVRFLPEGSEQTYWGGRRFIPYGAIDQVIWEPGNQRRRLLIRTGKQWLRLGHALFLLSGAHRLLRQRAVAATFEERRN